MTTTLNTNLIAPPKFRDWLRVRDEFKISPTASSTSADLMEQARGIYRALVKTIGQDDKQTKTVTIGDSDHKLVRIGILAKIFGDTGTFDRIMGILDTRNKNWRQFTTNFPHHNTLFLLDGGDRDNAADILKMTMGAGKFSTDLSLLALFLGEPGTLPDDSYFKSSGWEVFPEQLGIIQFANGHVSSAEDELKQLKESDSEKGAMYHIDRKLDFTDNYFACILTLLVAGVDMKGLVPERKQ
jgi:hypothetical protein